MHIMKPLKTFFDKVAAFTASHTKEPVHVFTEAARDIYAGLTEPNAMSKTQRHIDEYKLLSGGALTTAGLFEANILAVAGGSIPVCEALYDIEVQGHKWRQLHHRL